MVLLCGPGDAGNIVYNYMRRNFAEVDAICESPQSRIELARRRAKRLGWPTVIGQIGFVALCMPLLRRFGRSRVAQILDSANLDVGAMQPVHLVESVNDPGTTRLIEDLDPSVVVVHGTRIIHKAVLDQIRCPVVNLHAGITPRYRGVHGGYWALVDGRPDLVGSTVHRVDAGIDTGSVLAQVTFSPTARDSIATYPYLHLAAGLPALVEEVNRLVLGEDGGSSGNSRVTGPESGSRLWSHPTLWGYLWVRVRRKVR